MPFAMQQLNARMAGPLAGRTAAPLAAPPTPFVAARNQGQPRQQRRRQQRLAAAAADPAAAGGAGGSPAEPRGGRSTYRPNSYIELITDAVQSIKAGMAEGLTRMEVDFPAVAGVDGYKGSSDLYIDANIQLALAAAKQLYAFAGKRCHILLPDETEYRRAAKLFKSALENTEGVTLGHFMEGKPGALSGLTAFFRGPVEGDPGAGAAAADLFLALNASTIELADFETYVNETVGPARPVVSWNMELDLLRADLGLLGFPPKDLQYRFLSAFKPVFYIRQRDYSKTVAVAPFIINYSGALFREFPGPWQVMLRQDNGVYACVAEDAGRRYGLGEFKAALTRAMGLDETEGSAIAFLRTGYKASTWWEDDVDKEASTGWRT